LLIDDDPVVDRKSRGGGKPVVGRLATLLAQQHDRGTRVVPLGGDGRERAGGSAADDEDGAGH
jgi:hypothetical protein